MRKLLALDQSSRTSGYAVFNDNELITYGHFTFDDTDIGERLLKIKNKVLSLIDEYDINEVAFEDIYMDGQKVNNVATFRLLAEVFGVLYETFTEMEMPNTSVLAGTWKSTLGVKGKSRAEQKKNAQVYVQTTYGKKATQDECDAICIGAHMLKKKFPIAGIDWSD